MCFPDIISFLSLKHPDHSEFRSPCQVKNALRPHCLIDKNAAAMEAHALIVRLLRGHSFMGYTRLKLTTIHSSSLRTSFNGDVVSSWRASMAYDIPSHPRYKYLTRTAYSQHPHPRLIPCQLIHRQSPCRPKVLLHLLTAITSPEVPTRLPITFLVCTPSVRRTTS